MAPKNKSIDRLPPQNIEAEQSVLGALMLDKNAVINVADILAPEDFYKPAHEKIYNTILDLYGKREPIDILTVTEKLRVENVLREIGGSAYLSKLMEMVPTAAHIEHYAKIVRGKKVLRDLIKTSAEITENAIDETEDIETLLDSIEQKIFAILQELFFESFAATCPSPVASITNPLYFCFSKKCTSSFVRDINQI